MTDKIIISRKEIEELFAKYDMGRLSLSVIVDLRALLDKAEVSEPVGEPITKLAIDNSNLKNRISMLEDLLSSAYNIANRNGEETHWLRFAGQLHIHGISPITPKTFKILPSDDGYKPNRVTELESEIARLKAIIEDMKVVDNVLANKKPRRAWLLKLCCYSLK